MTYGATVIEVMIASPGDIIQERQIVREVIDEWNAINSQYRKLVLLPVGWETHSSPELGDRPQGVINKQVLLGCDLLIAIFWTRVGTPTGVAASGTIEEIEEHLNSGGTAMLYFSLVPLEASVPEPVKFIDAEQYAALESIKAGFRKRGLVEEYKQIVEFRDKVARQLAQTINRKFSPSTPEPGIPYLSEQARDLLIEAGRDEKGRIRKYRVESSLIVQTNGRNFVTSRESRVEARWRRALAELEQQRLVEDKAASGEEFFLTDIGYDVLERISVNQS